MHKTLHGKNGWWKENNRLTYFLLMALRTICLNFMVLSMETHNKWTLCKSLFGYSFDLISNFSDTAYYGNHIRIFVYGSHHI